MMRFLYAAALLLAAPLYVPRLLRSFWIDEAGTYWMAHEGFVAAIEKCSHWPGQSILYGALTSLFCLDTEGPWREPLLRFPSLIGIGLMLYYTSRLASRAVSAMAGLTTFILLLFHPASIELFSLARPYGLAAAAVSASFYFLYEWVETRERRFVRYYAIATTLIFYLHYLFVVALAAQGIYLAWVFLFEKRTAKWLDLGLALAAVGLFLLPLVPHMHLLLRDSHTLPVAGKPSLASLRYVLLPQTLMVGVAAAVAAAVAFRGRQSKWVFPRVDFLVLLAGWFAAGTAALFVISRLTTHHVFIPRYLGSAIPSESLALAALGAILIPGRWVAGWALLVALLTTANPLEWPNLWITGGQEARPAIDIVRQLSPAQPPLFFQSGLIESNFLDWRKGPEGTYLFSELVAYPVPNRIYPLPIRFTDEVKPYVSGLMEGELQGAPIILLICQGDVPEWFATNLAARGYRMALSRPNVYTVATFQR